MTDLSALVSSRICHDMMNPLGAIGNGLELLAMAGGPGAATGPELALIAESVARATARLRLFRLAFGAPAPGQSLGRDALRSILEENFETPRLSLAADLPEATLPRSMAQLGLLALLCAEAALPRGGQLALTLAPAGGRVRAEADTLRPDPAHWAPLTGAGPATPPGAAQVQFALLPAAARAAGRALDVNHEGCALTLRF
ncbi:histidine phosphotransferase ChpT [Rhodovulum iodosum]|uniref:Histidine phosphotransferase ChpT n=1 Tax=Rhodovulum iodosum TaxID=68291 RepID=A0ABV3XVC8_9RHOB|nr:histidine phosphotransferase family protein [Rhodovulum robiginosum]RSK35080.1 hypothetical protein EJA01_06700 [Rhodovulum robiginosum]